MTSEADIDLQFSSAAGSEKRHADRELNWVLKSGSVTCLKLWPEHPPMLAAHLVGSPRSKPDCLLRFKEAPTSPVILRSKE